MVADRFGISADMFTLAGIVTIERQLSIPQRQQKHAIRNLTLDNVVPA